MELTQTAEYALRAMAYLATLDDGASVTSGDLYEATRIPPAYLSKIMRRLVLADLVAGRKGHGGGFALARPPEEIRFFDVLAAAGYPLETDRCAFGWGRCNPTKPCPLHASWSQLVEQFNRWASETTLAAARNDRRLLENVLPRTSARDPVTTDALRSRARRTKR